MIRRSREARVTCGPKTEELTQSRSRKVATRLRKLAGFRLSSSERDSESVGQMSARALDEHPSCSDIWWAAICCTVQRRTLPAADPRSGSSD